MRSDLSSADDLQSLIDRQLPSRPDLVIRAGMIDDREGELFPEELARIGRAAAARRREFSTGRVIAREAMLKIGVRAVPIPTGANREPVWPAEVTGSITHTRDLAVSAVARKERICSLGVDLEVISRVTGPILRKVLTPPEVAAVEQGDRRLAALMFSAKEAGYKATRPLAGRYIGFQDAAVDVDWSRGRFQLRYLGGHQPSSIMESAQGYFLFHEPYVFSLVIIPAKD